MPRYAPRASDVIANAKIGSIDQVSSLIDNYEDTVSQSLSDTKKAARVASPTPRVIGRAIKRVPGAFTFLFITVWRRISRSFEDQDLPNHNAVEI